MKWRPALLSLCVSCAFMGSPASAGPFEGQWIGGMQGKDSWIYLQARFGGEGADMTGRVDLPQNGEEALLLERVSAQASRLQFEIPGSGGNLVFDGQARGADRVVGTVRQGWAKSRFELLRLRPLSVPQMNDLSGEYVGDTPGDVVLVFAQSSVLSYTDYANGRIGRLFALADGRFVAGPSVTAGFPVEITLQPLKDGQQIRWTRPDGKTRVLTRRPSYRIETVSVPSVDDVTLAGRLLVPRGQGRHPAVVMVPGSGRTTAESLMPFAHSLARAGIAVLVHDKRGVGDSTGSYGRAGIRELADDAVAAVEWLTRHPEIDGMRIGLVGTSLGGWVAPLAATRTRHVRFLVLESPPAVTPAAHERLRVESQMRADGARPEHITSALAFMDRKFAVGRTGEGWEDLQADVARGERDGWVQYVNRPQSLESMRWNWEHVLSYDPAPVLRQLRLPILALYGDRDRIVDPVRNREALEEALAMAGNREVTVHTFAEANHNFMAAVTGGPGEAARLQGFVDGYFDTRTSWLLARVETDTPALTDATVDRAAVEEGRVSLLSKAPQFQ